MSTLSLGSFVTHHKLPELGAGEVLASDDDVTRIRFAAGERAFRTDVVEPLLTVTIAAPVSPAAMKAARRRATRKS